ncbi:MAG: anti-sigma factor family protein [Longimicrobiales bacterium]
MRGDETHLGEELDLLLDGCLAPERQSDVDAHLARCARCRRELEALRFVKAAAHEGVRQQEVPEALSTRVTAALDRADREAVPRSRRARVIGRRVAIAAALGAAAVLVLLLRRPSRDDVILGAAEDFAQVRAGVLAMDVETADPATLERHFGEAGIRFPTRVFDFGMMGYRLTGGRVHRIEGRQSALFTYRSENGQNVVCQMYEGRLEELPPPVEERENNGIRFRIYRVEGVTLVFWQEGRLVCVLTSEGDAEEAIQLAYAKAMRV